MNSAHPANVLVVDDHPELCMILARLLRHAGHEATWVTDGAAALTALRDGNQSLDLVILDVMMPGLNGFEVLEAMRADHQTVPVVMYSALNDPESRQHAMDLGAQDYLVKSQVTYEELKAVVARYAGPQQ